MSAMTWTTAVAVWRHRVAALSLISLAAPAAMPAAAQSDAGARDSISWTYNTAFELPTAVDTMSYRPLLETCLAAIDRAQQDAARHELVVTGLWRDSLPLTDPRFPGQGPALLEPLPDTVVGTARQCLRLTPSDEALRHMRNDGLRGEAPWEVVLKAYLVANRDAEVATLITQRVDAVPAQDTARRRAVVDTALRVYRSVRPVRRPAIEAVLEQRLRAATIRVERIRVLDELRALADWFRDTTAMRARATQIVAEWAQVPPFNGDTASPEGRRAAWEKGVTERWVQDAWRVLYRTTLLDSLQHSTLAYLRAQRRLVYGDSASIVTGDTAPMVQAPYWFRKGTTARPRPGQVELIVAKPGSSCDGRSTVEAADWSSSDSPGRSCALLFSTLRRLGRRFPELGITVIVSARGALVQRAFYSDSVGEAEVLRQWLHDVEQLPGALAVQVVRPQRRPMPDGRLLWGPGKALYYGDEMYMNESEELSSNILGVRLVGRDGLVIDRKGTIAKNVVVFSGNEVKNEEETLAELIAAALKQPH